MGTCLVPCRVCGGERVECIGGWDEYSLMACSDCGFQFRDPAPGPGELSALYREGYFRLRGGAEQLRLKRHPVLRGLAARVRRYVPSGRLLDVGAARGPFVRAARAEGLDASGVELSEHDARIARDAGLPVRQGDFATMDLPRGAYDAVTLFDVVEHLPDPLAALRQAAHVLQGGGYLFVITGNTDAPRPKREGVAWHYYHMPGHVSFFSRACLVRTLQGCGFAPESVEASLADGRLDRAIGRSRSGRWRAWFNRYAPGLKRVIKWLLGRSPWGARMGGESLFVVARRCANRAGAGAATNRVE